MYRNLVKDDMTKEWLKMEDTTLVTREKSDVQKLMDEEFITLLKALGMVVFLIFVVLSMLFESPKYALMLMFSIPLGLFGAFLLMFVTGSSWNLMAIMGVLLLAGIVVNNGIRYVEAANQLSNFVAAANCSSCQIFIAAAPSCKFAALSNFNQLRFTRRVKF